MRLHIFFLIVAALWIAACDPVGQPVDQTKVDDTAAPIQESWNPTIRINSVGKENVQARANYSAHYEDPREIVFIGNVQLDFFDADGGHSSMLKADSGRVDEKQKLFTANGNVVVVSDSGMTLSTSILFWNETREAIYTDSPIVFTSEMDTLYGIGFESEADLSNWTIRKPTGVSYREFGNE